MMWHGRVCMVTGGAGFGGSHLCQSLLEQKARVYVLDRHLPRNSYLCLTGLAEQVEFLQGDIRDLESVLLWLERYQVQTIFHLAAQPIVPTSHISPLETLSINALGTYTLLEAARRSICVESFILASSGAYYGTAINGTPIQEDAPPQSAANLYAPSKVAADIAALCYADTYDIHAVTCRFINTYGPGDTHFSRIIPRAIRNLINSEAYDFGDRDDGSTRLDYMHVRDMARAYLCAAEKAELCTGQAFNFGAGAVQSTRQVAKTISLAYDGKDRAAVFNGSPRDQPTTKQLDISKAERLLDWKPFYNFEKGIQETVDWYRSNWDRI